MIIPRTSFTHAFKAFLRLGTNIGITKSLYIVTIFFVELVRGSIISRFQNGKNTVVLIEILDNKIYINTHDKGLSTELLTYRIHEPILSVLMLNEIKPRDVIVEVGANIGYYVLMECSLIKGNGRIIAVEPDPRSRKLLKLNVSTNGYQKNVEFLPYAIDAKRGTTKMLLSNAFNVSRVISPWSKKTTHPDGEEKLVGTMTIDDVVMNESKIDVIRMDIEGHEFTVIDGMIGTLTKFRPRLLVIELHPIPNRYLMLSFFEKLNSFGYEIKWATPRSLVDGMLEIPLPLLRKTCELIQNRHKVPNASALPEAKTLEIAEFAEKFCSSNQIYHVIFSKKKETDSVTNLKGVSWSVSKLKNLF